jgi:xanthine dehydrogenase molybdopterin binding subunit/xanthine dehydrogenase small subunit
MAHALEFVLNGHPARVEDASPNTTLLDYLRGRGMTGAKEGCAEGDCGACSVAIIDRNAKGEPCYRSINSCIAPLSLMAGREIVTVEALAVNGTLHPAQRRMVECHGSQCGYCTPGFILSLFEACHRDDIHDHDRLDDQLCGNLCRCTGYRAIREAALLALQDRAAHGPDAWEARLKAAPARLHAVHFQRAHESFFRPESLATALTLLAEFPEARLIAGATELGVDIAKRFKKFSQLISLEAIPELQRIRRTDTHWEIGGAATLTHIEETVARAIPALAAMLRVFGSRQIRNRATMGGNLVTASPIGDSAPVLLALNAGVVLASRKGERTLSLDEFFVSYRKTALQPGEILKAILVPHPASPNGHEHRCQWYKVSKRREMDISTVCACFAIELDAQNRVCAARLAYGGIAPTPIRARKTEQALMGRPWTHESIQSVLPLLQGEFTPISDVRGSAEYRRGLIPSLFEKFFAGETQTVPHREIAPVPSPEQRPPPHESARGHVTGGALYTDDQTPLQGTLEVWPVCAPHARAKILKRDAAIARQMAGIRAVLMAEDVPGENNIGGVKKDEPLFADREVFFHGQIVALVVGISQEACRGAAEKVAVEYEPLPAVLTLKAAIEAGSFHNEPNFIRRGNVEGALTASPICLNGEFELQGQDHFYLETQAAWAQPGEAGSLLVVSSTQHPSEIQQVVGHVLRRSANQIVVQCPRIGGGFGGKETQAAMPAALAALAAARTGHPVRVRLNRDQDMILTGHRHPFLARFTVGFDNDGTLVGARIQLWSNGGWAQDLSQAVTDRALFHLDNAYYIPAVEFRGQVAKTNLSSNTAFRGFGGPQGMLIIEEILDRIARHLGLPPEQVRERNLYRGHGESNTTHYGQEIENNRIQTIWHELKKTADVVARRAEIARWNGAHPHTKRGIAMTPVKFGISFTVTHLNQAGAFVVIYQDGTVQVNHGGAEMGQGLQTNILAIAAQTLGVRVADIRLMPTSTDKIPNTSATAASCGTDLNGAAVQNACEILRERLLPAARSLLKESSGCEPALADVLFDDSLVWDRTRPDVKIAFRDVIRKTYLARVSLSATGYYATPGIHWDRVAGRGKPFHYFACGAAVSEVEVDGFTGMHRLTRVDLLHDVGDSINAGINRGQVEGGFIQGIGWLTTEELLWDDQGRLLTHSPDTYKIPAVGDTPPVFNVSFLRDATQTSVIHGSKAVGEPPLMLGISVREAIRDAVAAFGPPGGQAPLRSPATCEAIYLAIRRREERRPN